MIIRQTLFGRLILAAAIVSVAAAVAVAVVLIGFSGDANEPSATPFVVEPTPVSITYEEVVDSIELAHEEAADGIDFVTYTPDYTFAVLRQCNGDELPNNAVIPDFIISACWSAGKNLLKLAANAGSTAPEDAADKVYLFMLKRTDELYEAGEFVDVPGVSSLREARAFSENAWDTNIAAR